MKNTPIVLAILIATTGSVTAADLQRIADNLAREARDFAEQSYSGFERRDRGNRADVEALYLVEQVSAGAALLRRMVADRRPESELRDALSLLQDQARASDRFGFGRREWSELRRTMDDLGRELRYRGDDPRGEPDQPGRVTGRMRWRGTVDDEIHVVVSGGSATMRLISGNPTPNPVVTFVSPLPNRPVTVRLNSVKGRGSIEILQQPSRTNGYSAVIQIRDPKGGASEHEFELVW